MPECNAQHSSSLTLTGLRKPCSGKSIDVEEEYKTLPSGRGERSQAS